MDLSKKRTRGGFSLIELLIVIAIITILAAGLTVAVVGIVDRTKRDKTEATLNILQTALNSYKNHFGRFPPICGGPGYSAGGTNRVPNVGTETALVSLATTTYATPAITSNSALHRAARNRAIRIYLEAPWRNCRDAPFIKGSDQIGRGSPVNDTGASDSNGISQYVDGWMNPLIFNRPGQNHAHDVNEDNQPIKQRYDTFGASGAANEPRWVFDIYSVGAEDAGITGANASTEYDRLDDYSSSHTNNGASTNNKHGDDIVSWGQNTGR